MTNREIYEAALALLGEDIADCADYEMRAPYLLGAVLAACQAADAAYRQAHGLAAGQEGRSPRSELDEAFPLCGRFAPAAAFYLAALLIAGENEVLSGEYLKEYREELTRITEAETPWMVHSM
jgi:hypothetical protein